MLANLTVGGVARCTDEHTGHGLTAAVADAVANAGVLGPQASVGGSAYCKVLVALQDTRQSRLRTPAFGAVPGSHRLSSRGGRRAVPSLDLVCPQSLWSLWSTSRFRSVRSIRIRFELSIRKRELLRELYDFYLKM